MGGKTASRKGYGGTPLSTAQKKSGMRIVRTRDSKGNASYSGPKSAQDVATGVDKVKLQDFQKITDTMNQKIQLGLDGKPVYDQSKLPEVQQPSVKPEAPKAPDNKGVITDNVTGKQFTMGPNGSYIPYSSATPPTSSGGTTPSPYQSAFESMKQSGIAAPNDSATAMALTGKMIPKEDETAFANTLVQTDPMLAQMYQTYQDYFDDNNQRESMVKTYQKMMKKSGIEAIDEELINMGNIIDGTEDDIRNEVTKAGGFATDSQVLALASARNKQLIKNYNTLLETRNSKERYLNTMIGLEAQDRTLAGQAFDRQMNFDTKIAEYTQRAQQYAADNFNKIVDEHGYKGLFDMTKGNPYYMSYVEDALGLGRGGLSRLASLPMSLDDRYKQAQIDKIYADLKNESGGYDPTEILAYAQQYGATGQIPTGLPKGSFGIVSQAARELPKADGTIVNKTTGVKDSGVPAAAQDDFGRLVNIVNNTQRLRELDDKRWGGVLAGTVGKVLGSDEQAEYMSLRKAIVDDLSRMQSGAALTPDEVSFYSDYLPGRFSNSFGFGVASGTKIDNFNNIMVNRLNERLDSNNLSMYGFSNVKVGGDEFVVGDLISNDAGQIGRVNPDGTVTIVQE